MRIIIQIIKKKKRKLKFRNVFVRLYALQFLITEMYCVNGPNELLNPLPFAPFVVK